MAKPSELELFLQAQVDEGRRDSGGRFTLERQKGLEKLAAFQLPRPGAWVLKMVQSAVAGGASALHIRQTPTDTEFLSELVPSWTLEMFEREFHDPEVSQDRSLDHLKRGLWHVGLKAVHPFRLSLAGSQEGLIWTGQEFQRHSGPPLAHTSVTVSHRTFVEGRSLLATLAGPQGNAAGLEELSSGAYVCPIPLAVDNRRLDRLQGCPSHGCTTRSYPLHLGFAECSLPPLALPPGTFRDGFSRAEGEGNLRKLLVVEPPPPSPSLACLTSIHVERAPGPNQWRVWRSPSLLYWVLDGVVVAKESIQGLPNLSVSRALFASADGLATDLSGRMIHDPVYQERRGQLLQASQAGLDAVSVTLRDFKRDGKGQDRWLALSQVASGALMLLLDPFSGFGKMGESVETFKEAGTDHAETANAVLDALGKLQMQWPQAT